MKRVAVLGGGPAGAFAAEQLASAGVRVTLFDEKLAWEKPCGGGLTYKAYRDYPFLIDNPEPKRQIQQTVISAPGAGKAKLRLNEPLLVYSRLDLNRMLLDRAGRAGAQVEKARVLEMKRLEGGWELRTSGGSLAADFCIVATGARNPLKNVGTRLTPADTMSALGYYVPGDQDHLEIHFLSKLEGYIWIFPRCGHLSVGICGKGEPAHMLRSRLEGFMSARDLSLRDARFYSHLLPSLEWASWESNRVAGDGWLAVGDAAGLVDPITGEGIYYAIRSADFAVRALLESGSCAEDYLARLRRDFYSDLQFASRLSRRFYLGRFLLRAVTARAVQFTRYSPSFQAIMRSMFDGEQPYRGLKRRLVGNLGASLAEITLNRLRGARSD